MQIHTLLSLIVLGAEALNLELKQEPNDPKVQHEPFDLDFEIDIPNNKDDPDIDDNSAKQFGVGHDPQVVTPDNPVDGDFLDVFDITNHLPSAGDDLNVNSCWLNLKRLQRSVLTCPDGFDDVGVMCEEKKPSGANCLGSTCYYCTSDYWMNGQSCERKNKMSAYKPALRGAWPEPLTPEPCK